MLASTYPLNVANLTKLNIEGHAISDLSHKEKKMLKLKLKVKINLRKGKVLNLNLVC